MSPVVRVVKEAKLWVSCLPLLAPFSLFGELGWPVLAFAKDHAVTSLKLLKRAIDVDGVWVVFSGLSGSRSVAFAVDSPSKKAFQLLNLVFSDSNRILQDAPVIHSVAWRNRH